MATQQERDKTYLEKQAGLGFAKVAIMFPTEYRGQLKKYVARKRREWEIERDGK